MSHFLIVNPSRPFAPLPLASQTWILPSLPWRRPLLRPRRGELQLPPHHSLLPIWWRRKTALPLSRQRYPWPHPLPLFLLCQKRRRRRGCSSHRHILQRSFILVLTFQHRLCLLPRMLQNFRLLWKMTHLHQCRFLPHRTTDFRGLSQLSVPRNLKERRRRKNSPMGSTQISSMGFGTARTAVVQKTSQLGVARVRSATSPSVAHVVWNYE